ncbi:nuclear transport factor 2 family protein [uncultured Sphaerotilus sp.]|uniref:nuclear transport factor 2 family protein n=1 Tax=uncultured Sphaerotilus sp. TaxID=474984 RepID=UPI0030CA1CD9
MIAVNPPNPRHPDPRVARVITFFERLAPADLDQLGALYAPAARFKDPFNEVHDVPGIRRVFAHMFDNLGTPRFSVLDAVAEGDQCFLTWDFLFEAPRLGPGTTTIHGSSHLRFGADGRLVLHRDYWDAAEELYEKLYAIGALIRWLKRRAAG